MDDDAFLDGPPEHDLEPGRPDDPMASITPAMGAEPWTLPGIPWDGMVEVVDPGAPPPADDGTPWTLSSPWDADPVVIEPPATGPGDPGETWTMPGIGWGDDVVVVDPPVDQPSVPGDPWVMTTPWADDTVIVDGQPVDPAVVTYDPTAMTDAYWHDEYQLAVDTWHSVEGDQAPPTRPDGSPMDAIGIYSELLELTQDHPDWQTALSTKIASLQEQVSVQNGLQ